MKYAMLVYSDQSSWEALSDEEAARQRAESMPRWITLFDELGKADPTAVGRELVAASEAKVVRVVDGETIVTDGPFADTKEVLGGIFLTELPDLDEAIRLAALVPAAEHGRHRGVRPPYPKPFLHHADGERNGTRGWQSLYGNGCAQRA